MDISSLARDSGDGGANLSHAMDCSASWWRFLLRNQAGDSGNSAIKPPKNTGDNHNEKI